jgi:hypothetical protein
MRGAAPAVVPSRAKPASKPPAEKALTGFALTFRDDLTGAAVTGGL